MKSFGGITTSRTELCGTKTCKEPGGANALSVEAVGEVLDGKNRENAGASVRETRVGVPAPLRLAHSCSGACML